MKQPYNHSKGLPVALIYLGLGTNLGFRRSHLREGLRCLRSCVVLTSQSDIMETAPVGPQDQPWYLNLVVEGITEFSPLLMLKKIKQIECEVGRRTTYRWGPRVLDIDLLLYDDLQLQHPLLTLPHPRMSEREFVMQPLEQIAPGIAAAIRRKS